MCNTTPRSQNLQSRSLQGKNCTRASRAPQQSGFTLVELVMVIIILSIVSLGVTNFIGNSTQMYVDTTERDDILSRSRFTVERLNRAIRYALPNSLRVATYAPTGGVVTTHCLEFFPIEWSTFYLDLEAANSAAQMLEGPNMVSALRTDSRYDESQASSHYAVVYPTDVSQVYVAPAVLAGNSGRITPIASVSASQQANLRQVILQRQFRFEEESTVERFYIVSNPVSYCMVQSGDAYDLYMLKDYGIHATQIANVDTLTTVHGASRILMAEDMVNDIRLINDAVLQNAGSGNLIAAPFRVDESSLKRNSIVHTLLMFERNDEVVIFNNEIHLRNSP